MTTRKREALDWVSLLEAILADTTSLPEAACIGHHDLFDEDQDESKEDARHRKAAAEQLCAGCPEAWRCPERTDELAAGASNDAPVTGTDGKKYHLTAMTEAAAL